MDERAQFFELAERLANASDPEEQQRLKEELARLTFDESTEDSVDGPL